MKRRPTAATRRSVWLAAATAAIAAATLTGCDEPSATAQSAYAQSENGAVSGATPGDAEPGRDGDAAKPAGRLLPRTFDDIKFDIEPDAPFERSMLTEEIEGLNGERIEIRGFILPNARKKLRDFVLVRDDQECCFGPGAALYDCILVTMAPGEVADFSVRPVTVEGEFRVEPFEIGGVTRAVFRMTANNVEN